MSGVIFPDRRLIASWWVLFPGAAVLTSGLALERACGDPYNLLPTLMSAPWSAWPIALLYVGIHIWLLAAYMITVSRTGKLVFHVREVAGVWRTDTTKLLFVLALLTVEYVPISLWQFLSASFGCTP